MVGMSGVTHTFKLLHKFRLRHEPSKKSFLKLCFITKFIKKNYATIKFAKIVLQYIL